MEYLRSGHFISATFENFQSEFLQMALYVILTIFLRQIGSAESKKIEGKEEVDREPENRPGAPNVVKEGGWKLVVYKNSLSIAFILLFLFSWVMHLYGSYTGKMEENALEGKPIIHLNEYLGEPTFWFETFQNWQSECLSVASIVILTIFLRQKGSQSPNRWTVPTWKRANNLQPGAYDRYKIFSPAHLLFFWALSIWRVTNIPGQQ